MKSGTDFNIIVNVPENAHICSDNRIYIVQEKRYYSDLKYNMDKKVWIGKYIGSSQMHPNDNYKELFPETIREIDHLSLPTYVKRVGIYAAALSICTNNGLYDDLITCFGPQMANLIMDYASYSIITKSNAAKDFSLEMEDKMLFLDKAYSDTWIDEKIYDVINDNQIQAFKNAWLNHFKKKDLSNTWICIDGSNNNCEADIDEAEKGKAKLHKNIDIISFIYAVTDNGKPIISQIYRGSRVDKQALKEMIESLISFGISPKGIILDRGFCDDECVSSLKSKNYNFVIMMKENINAFKVMMKTHKDEIKFSWKNALGNGLYGTTDTVKLFGSSEEESLCALIWDAKNATDRTDYFVDELLETIERCNSDISNGYFPEIPSKFKKYLSIERKKGKSLLIVNDDDIQNEMISKGYYGLISSMNLSAKEINDVYDLRDCSEKQYSIMKSQLGNHVFRAHQMHGISVCETIAFVASVIRYEIQTAGKSLKPKLDTNKVVKELNFITMNLMGSNTYRVIHNQSKRQKDIMALLKIDDSTLDRIAEYETKRLNKIAVSPIHTMSDDNIDTSVETRKISGIPEGSKAKVKTTKKSSDVKKGPGRPKGSKNKKVKRGPGRPKGSKNKRKPGRPRKMSNDKK